MRWICEFLGACPRYEGRGREEVLALNVKRWLASSAEQSASAVNERLKAG